MDILPDPVGSPGVAAAHPPTERRWDDNGRMPIDQDRPFRGAAGFYADHRYRISRQFAALVAARLGLDGSGRLLDLGCGPGILAERFAPYVREVVAADPEPDMLTEGRRRTLAAGITNIRYARASSTDLSAVSAGAPFRVVTIGQAFHWMRPQDAALGQLATVVEPAGAVVLIKPDVVGDPPLWQQRVNALVDEFLAGTPSGDHPSGRHDPFDELLRRSAFRVVEELSMEYDLIEQPSLVGALGPRYSISWVADRLGGRRAELEALARERFAWIDELPPQPVRHRDVALFGFRAATATG